jgi:hypothetical protein
MNDPFHQKRLDPFSDVVRSGVLLADFPQTGTPLQSVGKYGERKKDEQDVECFNHCSTSYPEPASHRGSLGIPGFLGGRQTPLYGTGYIRESKACLSHLTYIHVLHNGDMRHILGLPVGVSYD